MKKRLIITEEEKRRILGLHKLLIFEQPISDPDAYAKFMEKNPNPQPTSNDTTDEPYYPDEYGRKIGKPKEFEKRTTTSAEGKKQLTVNDLYALAGNDANLKRLLDSFTGQYEDATKLMLKSIQGETLTPEEEQTMDAYFVDYRYEDGTSDNFKTGMYDKLKKLYSTSSSQATTNSGTNSSAQIKFSKDKLARIESLPYNTFTNTPKGQPLVPGGSPATDEKPKPEETIVKDFDRAWDYKKSGEDVFVKRKNTEKWTKVGGETKAAILSQVFKDTKACVYPAGELCPGYSGTGWENPANTDQDAINTKIGFCSKKYCAVKYIQSSLNNHIRRAKEGDEGSAFPVHPSLKVFNEIKVDGKFGKDTQNLVYALMGKVAATPQEVFDK